MILEKNGRRGGFGFLNILHWVSAKTPHKIVDTAKAHASAVRCVSRQPFFLVIYFLLEFAVREDIKKAGCSLFGDKGSANRAKYQINWNLFAFSRCRLPSNVVQSYSNSLKHPNILQIIYGLIPVSDV